MMWCVAVLAALAFHGAAGSEYFLGGQGASCADVCAGLGRECNPNIDTDDSTDLFAMVNVDCTRVPPANNGEWWAADQPCYVTDPSDGNHLKCLGYKKVPPQVPCWGKHPAVRRLCRCVPQVPANYVLGAQGASCEATCQRVGRTCSPRIDTGDRAFLLETLGVDCSARSARHGSWWAHDQPCYVSGGSDPRSGQCLGFRNVPPVVSCSARHPNVQRLCNCPAQFPGSYRLGAQGETCTQTCSAVKKICVPFIETDNSDAIFDTLGVDCTKHAAHNGGKWWAHDQPCYVKGADPRTGQCLGWKNVPSVVNCDASHPAVQRVCNCQ